MPRDSSAFSLLDVLSETGFQSSVIATYCCYFPFYEEVVLLKQSFVLNPDLTVEAALKEAEKEIGAPAKISAYLRFALGEGIEKEETDFAAEVAAAVKK